MRAGIGGPEAQRDRVDHHVVDADQDRPVRAARVTASADDDDPGNRLVFEVLSGDLRGTGAPRCRRAASAGPAARAGVAGGCGRSVPPIRAGAGPAGEATKSGVGELLGMRPGGQPLPRPALVGSAITCSQERSLRATCAARAARPGRPRRRRRGGGWCGGSGLPRPPGWPRRAPGSWGGSAKSQAIVLNARCMRDERRLAGR